MQKSQKRMAKLCSLAQIVISPFAKVEVHGRQTLTDVGPFVAGANHRSLADLFVGLVAFKHLGVFPSILFNKKFLPGPLSKLATWVGVIVVDSGGATKAAINAVQNGASIMVMPEGKLFYDADQPNQLGPIKPGLARVARLGGAPMVAIAVDGTERVWPKGRPVPYLLQKRPTVIITVGEPKIPSTDNDQHESELLMADVASMLNA